MPLSSLTAYSLDFLPFPVTSPSVSFTSSFSAQKVVSTKDLWPWPPSLYLYSLPQGISPRPLLCKFQWYAKTQICISSHEHYKKINPDIQMPCTTVLPGCLTGISNSKCHGQKKTLDSQPPNLLTHYFTITHQAKNLGMIINSLIPLFLTSENFTSKTLSKLVPFSPSLSSP